MEKEINKSFVLPENIFVLDGESTIHTVHQRIDR